MAIKPFHKKFLFRAKNVIMKVLAQGIFDAEIDSYARVEWKFFIARVYVHKSYTKSFYTILERKR